MNATAVISLWSLFALVIVVAIEEMAYERGRRAGIRETMIRFGLIR